MEAFSRDLRVRVIKAYDEGHGSSRQLALVFGVSSAWIRKLLRLRRETGSIDPLPCSAGRKRKLNDKQRDRLAELAARQPSLTLAELKQRLRLPVSISTVHLELQRAGFTFKKSALFRTKEAATTSSASAFAGIAK